MGPRDRPHLTPQRLRPPFAATPHSVTWLSGQPDLRHPRQAGVDHLGRTRRGLGSRKCCLCVRRPPRQDEAGATAVRGGPGLFANWIPAFRQDPVVEVAGIEPASFVASTGLLRAQCACLCSTPPILHTSRCDGPSRCVMSRSHP